MSSLSDVFYPLAIDNQTGNLKMTSGHLVRQQNIRSLIETLISERIMNPSYGSELYLFDVISNLSLVNYRIKEAVLNYVPDVDAEVTSNLNQASELLVTITWAFLEDRTINTTPITFTLNF